MPKQIKDSAKGSKGNPNNIFWNPPTTRLIPYGIENWLRLHTNITSPSLLIVVLFSYQNVPLLRKFIVVKHSDGGGLRMFLFPFLFLIFANRSPEILHKSQPLYETKLPNQSLIPLHTFQELNQALPTYHLNWPQSSVHKIIIYSCRQDIFKNIKGETAQQVLASR